MTFALLHFRRHAHLLHIRANHALLATSALPTCQGMSVTCKTCIAKSKCRTSTHLLVRATMSYATIRGPLKVFARVVHAWLRHRSSTKNGVASWNAAGRLSGNDAAAADSRGCILLSLRRQRGSRQGQWRTPPPLPPASSPRPCLLMTSFISGLRPGAPLQRSKRGWGGQDNASNCRASKNRLRK